MMRVTAGILARDGKVLIARRKAEKAHGGRWEFPGGKIRAHETPQKCLQRELLEELEIEVTVGEYLGDSTHDDGENQIILMTYRIEWTAGNMRLHDHSEVRWISARELDAYAFTPADQHFVRQIRQRDIML